MSTPKKYAHCKVFRRYRGWLKGNVDYAEKYGGEEYIYTRVLQ